MPTYQVTLKAAADQAEETLTVGASGTDAVEAHFYALGRELDGDPVETNADYADPNDSDLDLWLGFENHYRCSKCRHEWQDLYECEVDDDCPKCRQRHNNPVRSEDQVIPDL